MADNILTRQNITCTTKEKLYLKKTILDIKQTFKSTPKYYCS